MFRRKYVFYAFCCLAIYFLYSLLLPYPWQSNKIQKSVSLLECQYCFAMTAAGCDTLFFSSIQDDSVLTGLTSSPEKVKKKAYGSAFWYSPYPLLHLSQGRLLTTVDVASADTIISTMQHDIRRLVMTQESLTAKREAAIEKEESFLSYYMSTHDIIDEGYNQMGRYEQDYRQMQEDMRKVCSTLKQLRNSDSILIFFVSTYIVHSPIGTDSVVLQHDTCQRISVKGNVVELQTLSENNAKGYYSITPSVINSMHLASDNSRKDAIMVTYNYGITHDTPLQELKVHNIQGKVWRSGGMYNTSIPVLKRAEGSPLFDKYGRLIGIVHRNNIIPL